jgi:hypothetical protein
MTRKGRLWASARRNVENHIGDCVDVDMTPEELYENVYVLAFDALLDIGTNHKEAAQIATDLALEYKE